MKMPVEGIGIRVREGEGIARRNWPLTRGVPLAEGEVEGVGGLWLEDGEGNIIYLEAGQPGIGSDKIKVSDVPCG